MTVMLGMIQQMQQGMQQGMLTLFAQQQSMQQMAGFQAMSAPALDLSSTPAQAPGSASGSVSTPIGMSFSALLGTPGRPVFSPIPHIPFLQTPQVPPSGGVVIEEQEQQQQQPSPPVQPVQEQPPPQSV